MSWFLPPRRTGAEVLDLRERHRASLRETYVELMPEILQGLEERGSSARVDRFRQDCRRLGVRLDALEERLAALEAIAAMREVHRS